MRVSPDNQTMEAKILLKKREANHVSINKIVIIGMSGCQIYLTSLYKFVFTQKNKALPAYWQ